MAEQSLDLLKRIADQLAITFHGAHRFCRLDKAALDQHGQHVDRERMPELMRADPDGDAGIPVRVSPHQLRHSFAVHMLAMLIQRRLVEAAEPVGAMEGYRQLVGDPLQQVQRLLGHSSLATTSIYLDHLATRADTVDAAVEELLALVPGYLPS